MVNHFIAVTKKIKIGISIFTFGVILNEAVLAIQGIAAFSYTMIPKVNEILFLAAVILFVGMGYTSIQVFKKPKINPPL